MSGQIDEFGVKKAVMIRLPTIFLLTNQGQDALRIFVTHGQMLLRSASRAAGSSSTR